MVRTKILYGPDPLDVPKMEEFVGADTGDSRGIEWV
jgi:hypothetical protein